MLHSISLIPRLSPHCQGEERARSETNNLCTFIGPLLELLVVACLLQEVHNGDSELGIRERVCLWVHTTLCSRLQQQQSQ